MRDHGESGAARAGLTILILASVSLSRPPSRRVTSLRRARTPRSKRGQRSRRRSAKATKPATAYTYTKDVAPILQAKCQNCHRRHQVGPFALETYEQARKRSHDIAAVTEERSMPPWKPTPGRGPQAQARPVVDPRRDRDPRRLGRGGRPARRPQGPAAAAHVRRGLEARAARPDPRAGRGLPDARLGPRHLPLLRPAHQPGAGLVTWKRSTTPPGERGAVHHLIAYIDTTGQGRQLDADAPGAGLLRRRPGPGSRPTN